MTEVLPEPAGGTSAGGPAPEAPAPGLDVGTYEVLRNRLAAQATELAGHAEALNDRRLEVFGGTELRLTGTAQIRTQHNCVPRDIASVGDRLLFGYNAYLGMKPETTVEDVFSVHRLVRDEDRIAFEELEHDPLLTDGQFGKDLGEQYRYYRESTLLQLRRLDPLLLAVFRTSPRADDNRVLRWRLELDGTAQYVDNKGERDHVLPAPHDFTWTETTRKDHVLGRHPHISIEGEVFVETIGGDLTIKVENNTESGEGIYTEPVVEPLQSLADADVGYARLGPLILLRIRPYKEDAWRYLIFNTLTRDVLRLDGIGQACQRLPEDQGLIVPGGYYLATGVHRVFDADTTGLEFERVVRSTNGEDVLYVFHDRNDGRYLLLPYNVIRKEIANPIACHGYAFYDDGTMVVLRATSSEPSRIHHLQVWQTPYVSDAYAAAQPVGTGPLERIGNADLVRGISDLLSVARMAEETTPTSAAFDALIGACRRAVDRYHWLGENGLEAPLAQLRRTAEQVREEFEKVQSLRALANEALEAAESELGTLIRGARTETPATADAWAAQLASLRRAQGRVVGLREVRYIDQAALDALAGELTDELATAGRRAVEFLRGDGAFDSYEQQAQQLTADAEAIASVAEATPLAERLDQQSDGLAVVTEVLTSLDIEDANVRTELLARIGNVLGSINRARATLDARRRELLAVEGRAQFAAEFALLGQAVTGALAVADSPEACDEQLAKLMAQVEGLESRFGHFDEFLGSLAEKREDVYEAFSARKQALLDDRQRRANRLAQSADRILGSVQRRATTLATLEDVNTYFATDPMVGTLRGLIGELRTLGDPIRAEEFERRLATARQEAGRSLRDRTDLYDGDTIRLGRHRFAVNTQPAELTLVPHEGRPMFAITGTDYRAPVTDPTFAATAEFWDQPLVSEDATLSRVEYLAGSLLLDGVRDPAKVQAAAAERYEEGYERGVHDQDAAAVLRTLVELYDGAGLLRYPPAARAAAQLFWAYRAQDRGQWEVRARSLTRAREIFGTAEGLDALTADLAAEMTDADQPLLAAEYLIAELANEPFGFVTGPTAAALVAGFERKLGPEASAFDEDLKALGDDLPGRYQLAHAWLSAYAGEATGEDLDEAVALLLIGDDVPRRASDAVVEATVDGLLSAHPRIEGRTLRVRLDDLLARVRRFADVRVPAFRAYQKQRNAVVAAERDRLRLDELKAGVLSSFVRNQLVDQVFLPLIGDNLAKQLGTVGPDSRTDQMGLLLLLSPPGYGKTTLMEYVASRLGLVFVKINGPALGHDVTSLDPEQAPNAAARREVEKISFALELGNNTLLYLDDIQHTSPELLQKFISLCDATRRMDGVWNGETRTYDLRGKRFAVCMAGNPYTESGQRFQVPDMLANRADVWNLGDVLSGREEQFALSFLENSLTSNPVLAPLSTGAPSDVELLVRLARGDATVRPDQLEKAYSSVELDQILGVLRHLLRVQRVVLANNEAYIASAAQADASRTEPPYRLQGSYRNMNKMAQRVLPVMNEAELEAVIDDHYVGEAQTLAADAEANLLKLAELRGKLTPEAAARWEAVKEGYLRERALGGTDDPLGRAVGAVGLLADRVRDVEQAITRLHR
ncbi:DNA repair ATPase [Cryptosporangium aurantiacum]|uniref:AAA domain (Dynein-related subfamily) n=1 Tax=Cryptosporangium aurantiacum TaxID=134849 RepID=A0A1M7RNB6_9ACTN|nr:DNA repair ATPase [Cryptosporangium aurantiacum]SHN47566.1 AAA domain (dynein-related subfamily) [Cryptosporangium aurantiacum]